MTTRVALVHAMLASLPPVERAFARGWPEARLVHLLDDSLPEDLEAAGDLADAFGRRFVALARYAEECGAEAVLFTCSAFGAAIESAAAAVRVPVLKPNEAMVEEAVREAGTLVLLATFAPTLASMSREIAAAAQAAGSPLRLSSVHVPDALEALVRGEGERHDELVARAASEHAPEGAVVALAQFSMARAATRVSEAVPGRVLTTPDSAVKRLREALGGG